MNDISELLAQILSAVYGRDVRSSIHDAIAQCYSDISSAKTIAEDSAADARDAAEDAETRSSAAITAMQASANTAIANCNSATTTANNAAVSANASANRAEQAADDVTESFAELGLKVVDGKLCIAVERSE